MTDRPTASTITDPQLDALHAELAALRQIARGYCPHCGRGDAAPTVADWEQQRHRADQLAALAHDILYTTHITSDRITRWRETLDQLTEQPHV